MHLRGLWPLVWWLHLCSKLKDHVQIMPLVMTASCSFSPRVPCLSSALPSLSELQGDWLALLHNPRAVAILSRTVATLI